MKTKYRNTAFALLILSVFPCIALAQDCQLPLERTAPDERFQVNVSDPEVAIDLQTGLSWQRCVAGFALNDANTPAVLSDDTCLLIDDEEPFGQPDGEVAIFYTWAEALLFAESFGSGWRLPNIKELSSLTERACIEPAINGNVFPNASSLFPHWSATPDTVNGANAWTMSFQFGDDATTAKNTSIPIYLVRD